MSPHSDSTSSGEPAQVRVLYAEDNADDVDLTRRYFAMHAPDIWLDVVRTAAACVEELARHRHDALLLDYRLPDLDGVDVLRALAAKGWRIPVIVTTAAGDEELAVRVLRLGAADYLPKDGDYLRLLPAAIRQAVDDQRTRDARGLEVPPSLRRVLYVEQHPADIDLTVQRLTEALPSVRIEVMRTAMEALARVRAGAVDLVLADLRMPDMSAVDLLREMRYSGPRVPLIVITGRGDETAAVAAIKLGAYDYIVKRDGYLTHLPYVIEHAMTRHQLTEVNDRLRRELAERARLQEATDESFALLDTLQKHAPIGIAFMDREFRYQQVNDELAAINGLPASAHLGRAVAEIVPQIWTQVEPLCRRALAGETARAEVAGAADDVSGERRFVAHHYPVRRATGQIIGIGVAVAEVTEQKRAEAALREQTVALAEASQHKDEFLAMLSHELRNPLAPVRTALDLLRRPVELDSLSSAATITPARRHHRHSKSLHVTRRGCVVRTRGLPTGGCVCRPGAASPHLFVMR